jgi:FKBP-type peptidyl-prolyl cis-trans isomerase
VPFDSRRSRNQIFHFLLGGGQVIEGLDVAVSKMSVGQLVEATIPYPYHYGIAGYPPVVPPRSTLIFRVELIRFESR